MFLAGAAVCALSWLGSGTILLHEHDHEGVHFHRLSDAAGFDDRGEALAAPGDRAVLLRLPDLAPVAAMQVTFAPAAVQLIAPPPCDRTPHVLGSAANLRQLLVRIHGPPGDLLRSATLLLI
jgi:hypothetical protein